MRFVVRIDQLGWFGSDSEEVKMFDVGSVVFV